MQSIEQPSGLLLLAIMLLNLVMLADILVRAEKHKIWWVIAWLLVGPIGYIFFLFSTRKQALKQK